MAYEPTVWKSGDVVTSDKLNKLEQGVASSGGGGGGGVLVVHDVNGTLDKTWQEIFDASFSGIVLLHEGSQEAGGEYSTPTLLTTVEYVDEKYYVVFPSNVAYFATSKNAYPQHE